MRWLQTPLLSGVPTRATNNPPHNGGWVALRGAAFSAPPAPELLCVVVGAGAHFVVFAAGALALFACGWFSPEHRDSWAKGAVALFLYLSQFAAQASRGLWLSLIHI